MYTKKDKNVFSHKDLQQAYENGYKQGQKDIASDLGKFGVLVVVFVIISIILI